MHYGIKYTTGCRHPPICIHMHIHTHTYISANSSAQSGRYKVVKMHRMPLISCLFPQNSHYYRTLLHKITYENSSSYASSPPCTIYLPYLNRLFSAKCPTIMALLQKETYNLRHLMHLRHPARYICPVMYFNFCYVLIFDI